MKSCVKERLHSDPVLVRKNHNSLMLASIDAAPAASRKILRHMMLSWNLGAGRDAKASYGPSAIQHFGVKDIADLGLQGRHAWL
jgi:hypothetical protein